MRHIFIINPAAGKGSCEAFIRNTVTQYFDKNGGTYDILVTKAPLHAAELAKNEAQKSDAVRIYACGGDGTLNEVVNGAARYENAEIACYPAGTGDDFIKNFGKRQDFLDISELINGEAIKTDLIKYDGRLACNVCSAGLDAEVAFNMNRFKKLPLLTGHMAYNLALIFCLLSKIKSNFDIVIDNDKKISGSFLLAVAANGKWYGGGYMPAPLALTNDGTLDFVLANAVSRLRILEVINKYKTGEHIKLKDIISYYQGSSFKIASKKSFAVNIDGECFTTNLIEFGLLKSAMNFVLPKRLIKA